MVISCYNGINKWITGGNMIVGQRVKTARLNKNLSQEELGNLLGVTKVSVCGYERGTRIPTLSTFLSLSEILDLEPNYLLGRDVKVVSEQDAKYCVKMAKEDIRLIQALKKHPQLHKNLRLDPDRYLELIERKLK